MPPNKYIPHSSRSMPKPSEGPGPCVMDQLGIVITGDMRVHVTCLPEFPADVELATDWSHAIFHTDHSTKNTFHQLCTLVCTIKRFELKESVQESLPCCLTHKTRSR